MLHIYDCEHKGEIRWYVGQQDPKMDPEEMLMPRTWIFPPRSVIPFGYYVPAVNNVRRMQRRDVERIYTFGSTESKLVFGPWYETHD